MCVFHECALFGANPAVPVKETISFCVEPKAGVSKFPLQMDSGFYIFFLEESFSPVPLDVNGIYTVCLWMGLLSCVGGVSVLWMGGEFFSFPFPFFGPEELLTSSSSEALQRSPDFLALQSTAPFRKASTSCKSGIRSYSEN